MPEKDDDLRDIETMIMSTVEEKGIEMDSFCSLIDAIIGFYTIGTQRLDDGEEWKKGTEYDLKDQYPRVVKKEVEKAFLHQIKKFQD